MTYYVVVVRAYLRITFCCRYDMILWATGQGDNSLENKYFMFRRSYAQLYHHMKPGKVRMRLCELAPPELCSESMLQHTT